MSPTKSLKDLFYFNIFLDKKKRPEGSFYTKLCGYSSLSSVHRRVLLRVHWYVCVYVCFLCAHHEVSAGFGPLRACVRASVRVRDWQDRSRKPRAPALLPASGGFCGSRAGVTADPRDSGRGCDRSHSVEGGVGSGLGGGGRREGRRGGLQREGGLEVGGGQLVPANENQSDVGGDNKVSVRSSDLISQTLHLTRDISIHAQGMENKIYCMYMQMTLIFLPLTDYVDSSIQYMALFVSITVCSIILGLVLVFCFLR